MGECAEVLDTTVRGCIKPRHRLQREDGLRPQLFCLYVLCMHIINLCRSITNQINLVSKKHFERNRISLR